MKNFRYQVVVPSFNCIDFLPKCLESIEAQQEKRFDVCIIDDASTLPQQRTIIETFCERNSWKSIFHQKNQGALYSLIHGIQTLNPNDEDVILVLDGDDWLAHPHVFQRLDQEYHDPYVWITWGQFNCHPKNWLPIRYASGVGEDIIRCQGYREIPWIFGHPRTFRAHLWRRIHDQDFRDEEGNYLRLSGDQAFMLPMLEMAGAHGRFISDVLYTYNLENPLSDFKLQREEQKVATAYIRAKTKYPAVERP